MRRFGVLVGALVVSGALAVVARGAPESDHVDCDDGGEPTETVEGSFTTSDEGAYVMVPFEVPEGTTRVRLRLSHDQIALTNPVTSHTLDLGMYGATDDGFWDEDEFRGWGGSSRLDQCVSQDEATLGFRPGPVAAGTWAAEIGVAAVAGPVEGDPDGTVDWKLEVFLSDTPPGEPWSPSGYDDEPVASEPGWYAGDFHVHAEHSNPNDATMREVFDAAFEAENGPQLDFVTLSDYVTDRHWDEIGRFQADYPDHLIIRSAEVITYRGHVVNHASLNQVDHRTGPVYEWDREARALGELLREARPASEILEAVRAGGRGWTQVAHPTIFPAKVPAMGNLCRGCSWEYSDAETDWDLVDAMEVQTGPAGTPEGFAGLEDGAIGPNPFTPLALEWFDRLQRRGYDITAVGASDSHRALHQELLAAPIGEAQTVVFAPELSETGIRDGILAGHAYVKFFGSHGPDLRFEATPLDEPGAEPAIMGDELEAKAARFVARVRGRPTGPGELTLHVFRDGLPLLASPVPWSAADEWHEFEFVGAAPGDYRLQLMRGTAIEAVTNPVNLELPVDLDVEVPGAGIADRVHRANGLRGLLHGRP